MQAEWETYESEREPLLPGTFKVAIYFADATVNLYQVQQWYEPMRILSDEHPVVVIARKVKTANELRKQCPMPVVHMPFVAGIEEWLSTQDIRLVFYVNQNTKNFQMMRFRDPAHVFISHGESDKDYMASNQLKAYDYTFVAGDAAIARISQRLIDFDVETRLIPIGRPQVDVTHPAPPMPADGRTVVLYAPTWEGDRPSMTYSSLRSHAEPMLSALLATGRHRVIYRPHPRTGAYDRQFTDLHESVVRTIRAANVADPAAQHIVDTDSAFGWQISIADACICDISAVAFDWLATGKPLLLTRPASDTAEVDENGLPGLVRMLESSESSRVVEYIDDPSSFESSAVYGAIVERYFGDCTPGASMGRFTRACSDVIATRSFS